MSKPKSPAPPDPRETAAAQTNQNVGTAIANTMMGQVNQVGPDGTLTYDQTGSYNWRDPNSGRIHNIPTFTATTELSKDGQAIRDAENASRLNLANLAANQSDRADDLLSEPFDPSGIIRSAPDRRSLNAVDYTASNDLTPPKYQRADAGALPAAGSYDDFGRTSAGLETSYVDDFSEDKQVVEDALMGRLNLQFDEDLESLRTNLLNRGIQEGTEAYDREMRNFEDRRTRARTDVMLAAGHEQSRLAGLSRDQAAFGNAARQQEFQNDFTTTGYNNDLEARRFSEGVSLFGLGEQIRADNNNIAAQEFGDQQVLADRRDWNAEKTLQQELALADAVDNQDGRQLEREYAARNQAINEISALLSGGQVATPNFQIAQPTRMPTTDIAGITQQGFNNQMGIYGQEMGQYNAMMGGLFGLGSAGILAA